jgi:protein-disulfide isomerase
MKTPTADGRSGGRQSIIDVLVTIAIVIAVGVVIWRNWPEPLPPPIPIPAEPLVVDDKPARGSDSASVVLIGYSDFQCPYCGVFARDTLPGLDREYVASGKIQVMYSHVTPPNHPRALPAAIAADCAARQGKFWEMHDRLFADQTKLDDASLASHAKAIGLDETAFSACQSDPAVKDRIARETTQSRSLRVAGTPGFFIGRLQPDGRVKVTRSIRGAAPLENFQDVLDEELGEGSLGWLYIALAAAGSAGALLLGLGIVRRRRHALA